MKEWFLWFALHAIWRRRKALYYAVSVISIVGNLAVLVGPSVQTLILSQSSALPLVSTAGLLQMLQAAPRAYVGSLQTRARNALPQVSELVLQRSVLYILLNLIVVRIMVKSGVLARRMTAAALPMKPDDIHLVNNFQVLSGSHWLAPSYLHTVCSTISNVADVSTNPSTLLQHVPCVHVRGSAAAIADAQAPLMQHHPKRLHSHDEQGLLVVPALATTSTTTSPAPAPPSLFTIEPLDELVQSMKPHQTWDMDAQVSRHPLRKVATKVDLLQAVRTRRRTESKPKVEMTHQQKAGRVVHGVRDGNGIRRREQEVQQIIHDKGEVGFVNGGGDKHGVRREEQFVQSLMHGDGEYGTESEGERYGEGDDSELSRQELKDRADTYISKVKRNLTIQRKDSLNRLLGLCQRF